jgi:hypothetical protein
MTTFHSRGKKVLIRILAQSESMLRLDFDSPRSWTEPPVPLTTRLQICLEGAQQDDATCILQLGSKVWREVFR